MQSPRLSSSTTSLPRLLGAVLATGTLFVLLGACAEKQPPSSPQVACMAPGTHCEYDGQCCSHRCYHDTGCVGGTP